MVRVGSDRTRYRTEKQRGTQSKLKTQKHKRKASPPEEEEGLQSISEKKVQKQACVESREVIVLTRGVCVCVFVFVFVCVCVCVRFDSMY